MNAMKTMIGLLQIALFCGAVAFLIGVTGCAMTEPLATEHLQQELKDERVSIILLRFKSPPLPPARDILSLVDRNKIFWRFAAANESTGWNFRHLDNFSMVFRTRDDSPEPGAYDATSGWVTFLVPPGLSYIAVSTSSFAGEGQKMIAAPFPDHISVGRSAEPDKADVWPMDFIDVPRFAVQVDNPRSLIYAGTIVRSVGCGTEEKLPGCLYELSVIDESRLAKEFISRYPKGFAIGSAMQTQLLAIPLSRTIEIRGGPAGSDQLRQQ